MSFSFFSFISGKSSATYEPLPTAKVARERFAKERVQAEAREKEKQSTQQKELDRLKRENIKLEYKTCERHVILAMHAGKTMQYCRQLQSSENIEKFRSLGYTVTSVSSQMSDYGEQDHYHRISWIK